VTEKIIKIEADETKLLRLQAGDILVIKTAAPLSQFEEGG